MPQNFAYGLPMHTSLLLDTSPTFLFNKDSVSDLLPLLEIFVHTRPFYQLRCDRREPQACDSPETGGHFETRGGWRVQSAGSPQALDLFPQVVERALAFCALTLSPSNSRMVAWCTNRSMAAIVVMGSLKIWSHFENTRLLVIIMLRRS
jgi:hypothetical protein